MRLESFHVQGFKSLVDVKLDNLGDINVFHGPNNVGKSNILEAISLFFELLEKGVWTPGSGAGIVREHGRVLNVFPPAGAGRGIHLAGALRTAPLAASVAGATISYAISPDGNQLSVSAASSKMEDITGASSVRKHGDSFPREIAEMVRPASADGNILSRPFVLVDSLRRTPYAEDLSGGEQIVPQSLRDAFFDTKEHDDAAVRDRWSLFQQVFRELAPPVGPLDFDTSFDRSSGRANLIQIANGSSTLLDDLGTGIQQLVALVGHLLTTNASIVGIEEPELNLSYGMQKVLRGMLERIVEDPAGPSQLFITSHSPAFDGQDSFYRVSMVDRQTRVEAVPPREKWTATQWPTDSELEDKPKPPDNALGGYVTADRLVELPEDVVTDMGLETGESVVFAKGDDGYWKLVGPREWDELMEGLGDE